VVPLVLLNLKPQGCSISAVPHYIEVSFLTVGEVGGIFTYPNTRKEDDE
jgi:hypothetical protein